MVEAYHLNALPPGKMLQEFEVLRVLGEGGFGIVYLTKGRYLDDLVAIKEYLPAQLATRVEGTTITPTSSANHDFFEWGRQKFLEEARMLSQLSNPRPHPNIVAVRRFFELHGTAYMVMDYEQGEPLSDLLSREAPLPEERLLALTEALLDGLEAVHAAGITHRDVKPSNILVREDGSPVLLDFGAARLALGERTQSAFNAVSPAYAAPEQLMDSEKAGPWTDLYGLGATLYRAVTGRLPQPAVDRLVAEDHVPAAELVGDRCAPGLLRAIDAALALKPERRPQSVAAWRALTSAPAPKTETDKTVVLGVEEPAEDPGPAPARPAADRTAADRTAKAPRRSERRRRLAAAVAFCGLFVALGATFAAYQLDGWEDAGEQARRDAELAAQREAEAQARRDAEAAAQGGAEAAARREAEARARREVDAEAAALRAAEAAARREAEAQARREAEAAAQHEAARRAVEAELAAQREAEARARREAEAAAQREADAVARREAEAAALRKAEAARREAERLAKAAEEARLRAEAVDRQIAALARYMEQNREAAEQEFRAFVADRKLLDFRERFRRVISFGDVAFEDSEYRVKVHFSYCRVEQGGCTSTSREARVSVRFEGGKLLFLRVI